MMRPRETPPKTQTCAIYARVSPKPEGAVGDNYSIESQLHEMRALARKKYGCEEPHEFIDRNASGATLDRPELDRLRDNLAQKIYRVVIAYSPDRWTRGGEMDAVILKMELEKSGAKIDFVSGSYEDTPEGELSFDVQNAVSKYERAKFRERSRRCRRQKSRDKFLHSCHAPDGYEYQGHKFGHRGRYVIVKARAKVVLLIFTKLAGGWTLGQMARYLNAQRIRTQKGNEWYRESVSQVAEKTAYYGEVVQNGETIKVPAIVSRELWDRAHEALAQNKVAHGGRPSRHYLLSGLLWCARCKKRCTTRPRPGEKAAYRCNHVDPKNRSIRFCRAPQVLQAVIEQAVWNAVWDAVCDPGLLWRLIEAYHDRMAGRPTKKDPGKARIDRARRKVERAEEILADPDQPYQQSKELLEAARRELAEAQLTSAAKVAVMPLRKDVAAASEALRAMRAELQTFERRRKAIKLLVQKILYEDGKAEIHCLLPAAEARNCNRRIRDDYSFSDPVPFVIECQVATERTAAALSKAAFKGWETRRANRKRRAA